MGGPWGAGNDLFFELGAGFMRVSTLWNFTEFYYDLHMLFVNKIIYRRVKNVAKIKKITKITSQSHFLSKLICSYIIS